MGRVNLGNGREGEVWGKWVLEWIMPKDPLPYPTAFVRGTLPGREAHPTHWGRPQSLTNLTVVSCKILLMVSLSIGFVMLMIFMPCRVRVVSS